jgi:hypothetical protein
MVSAYTNVEDITTADALCAQMLFNHGILSRVAILTNIPALLSS